jgi:hypothetical protein
MALAKRLAGLCWRLSASPDGVRSEPLEAPPFVCVNGISVQEVGGDQWVRRVVAGVHVDCHQSGGQMGVFAVKLNAMVGAEVEGALPAVQTNRCAAATSSTPSSTAISCSRRTSSVNKERAHFSSKLLGSSSVASLVVDKRHQAFPLNEVSKLPLACLLAHCIPLGRVVDYRPMEAER